MTSMHKLLNGAGVHEKAKPLPAIVVVGVTVNIWLAPPEQNSSSMAVPGTREEFEAPTQSPAEETRLNALGEVLTGLKVKAWLRPPEQSYCCKVCPLN